MKILNIAAAVALGTVSLSAVAKDIHEDNSTGSAFTVTAAASGPQSFVVGEAIEGRYSMETAVAVGVSNHYITGTGGHLYITGTGGSHYITGTGGSRYITGTGGNHYITGTGGSHYITGTGGHH